MLQDEAARAIPATERSARPALAPTSVGVAVCTHARNEPLLAVLRSLDIAAQRVQPTVAVGVVVVDDNPDGRARPVVEGFDGGFALGLHYRFTGAQNISVARNAAIDGAMDLGEWVAMIDDDEIASERWLEELLAVQQRTGAGAVTGPVLMDFSSSSPAWLSEQPFGELFEQPPHRDGTLVTSCSTGNSLIRTEFLRRHPNLRFRPELGRLGGEDMVFYRSAIANGLEARFASHAVCLHPHPPERSTYRHLLRVSFWLGNSEFVTNHHLGAATRSRLMLRGGRRLLTGLLRPVENLVRRQPPHLRFCGVGVANGLGILSGVVGCRVRHP